jgi:UDP-2,4-diacetamido-2,4,6-trideoxy-beta-L-altropyranose hydrolase
MHLTIRADGGGKIGYGHLVRTAAIAREFLDEDHTVTYATTTPETAEEVCPGEVEVTPLASRSNPSTFLEWIQLNQPDAVLIDAYPADTEYQQRIREHAPLAVYIDDARYPICADILINGNLYASELTYDFVGNPPKQLLGPDFVPLREEVRLLADQEPPWRDPPRRALITMGGSDIENRTPTVIRSFDGFDLQVDAIVGPGFSEQQERAVRAAAEAVTPDVSVSRDPENLVERMFQADVAVSTASSTTYELLAVGTPIVCQPVAENQQTIAETLENRDMASVIDECGGKSSFQCVIEQYAADAAFRKTRRERGRKLIDANGVARIYDEIIETIGRHSSERRG